MATSRYVPSTTGLARNAAITAFNFGKGRDLANPDVAGDGFLMRHGFSVMWSGWQGDLIDRGPDSAGVLKRLREFDLPGFRLVCLAGKRALDEESK